MKRLTLFVLLALLSACSVNPPKPVEVKVPVAVSCLGELPSKPVYEFGVGAIPSPARAVALLASDFELSLQYSVELEAAMSGCLLLPK